MDQVEAGVRELVARLADFDRRLRRLADAAGWLAQTVKLIGAGFEVPTPSTCTEVTAFPTIMDCIPQVMPFLIAGTTYGFGTVTWNGSTLADPTGYWAGGCVMHTRLATAGCTQRDIPVFVSLRPNPADATNPSWTIRLEWINTGGGTCPDSGKTCADFASVTHFQDTIVNVGTLTPGGQLQPHVTNLSIPAVVNGAAALNTPCWFNVGNLATCVEWWFPSVINITDATWGNFSATWAGSGGSTSWQFCHAGLAYPGHGTCGAVTFALHYNFFTDGTAQAFTPSATSCPQASTCTTTGGALAQTFTAAPGATDCSIPTVAWAGTGNNIYLGAAYAITASF